MLAADAGRMQEATAFPASAANSLITGYCQDFVELAASMAQTLEQVTMRNLELGDSRERLVLVERGMRELAEAIAAVLDKVPPAAPCVAPQQGLRPAAAPMQTPTGPQPQLPGPQAPATRPAPSMTPGAVGAEARGPGKAPRSPQPDRDVARTGPHRPAASPPTAPTIDATRLPPRPTASCMLQGSNDTMPLRSVFQFLSRMRKSGTLRVMLDTEEMTFDLSDGCMVATTSTCPPNAERIGDLLVDLGFVDPLDLEAFAKQHGDGLRQLGGALVNNRRITEGQLAEALEQQVSRRFQRAVGAPTATYDFRECPRPGGDGRIRIRAFEILAGEEPGQ